LLLAISQRISVTSVTSEWVAMNRKSAAKLSSFARRDSCLLPTTALPAM
jgi:hypothetical protein